MDIEDLRDLTRHDGFKLLLREIESLVQLSEKQVLTHDLNDSDLHKLLVKKARAEGARRLFQSIQKRLDEINPKTSGGVTAGRQNVNRREESK